MKRHGLVLMIVTTLFLGCSDSQPVDKQAKDLQNSRIEVEQARAYGKKLADLRVQAAQLEQKLEFAAAADVWQRISRQIRSDFGENSWQAINAQVAHKLAEKKMKLKPEFSTQLSELGALQRQINAAHRAKDNGLALKLSKQLLQLQEPLFGDVSMETARIKMQIGTLAAKLGLDEEAAKNLHSGIEIFRSKGIELHPELEASLAGLAEIYTRRQKYAPAVGNQKAATRIAGLIWGKDSLQYANQANQLGVIFHRAGNDQVAFDVLKTAKQIREEKLGTQSVNLLIAVSI